MRRTAEDAAATRAALLDAAMFVFAHKGVASATLADVASRARVTRGAVYHHFGSKTALHAAVLGESWDMVAAPVWAALDGPAARGAPLGQRLRAFAEAWVTALRTDARFQALMAVSLQSGAAEQREGPVSMAEKAKGFAAWHARLTAALTAGRAELSVGVDPQAAATHLLAWLCGTALLAGTDPDLLPPVDTVTGAVAAIRGFLR